MSTFGTPATALKSDGHTIHQKPGSVIHTGVSTNKAPFVYTYRTGQLIRNRKASPGWISYLRMGVFYTYFSIMNP